VVPECCVLVKLRGKQNSYVSMTDLVVSLGSQADRGVDGGRGHGRVGAVSTSLMPMRGPYEIRGSVKGLYEPDQATSQSIKSAFSVFGNHEGNHPVNQTDNDSEFS